MRKLFLLTTTFIIILAGCGNDNDAIAQNRQDLLTVHDSCRCTVDYPHQNKRCILLSKDVFYFDRWNQERTKKVLYPAIMCGLRPCPSPINISYTVNCRRF
jgi:hypothetical protein